MTLLSDGRWRARLRRDGHSIVRYAATEIEAQLLREELSTSFRRGTRPRAGYERLPDGRCRVTWKTAESRGGRNDPANLTTACADCNIGKSASLMEALP